MANQWLRNADGLAQMAREAQAAMSAGRSTYRGYPATAETVREFEEDARYYRAVGMGQIPFARRDRHARRLALAALCST
jgi:hypothetical protein